MKFSRKPIAAVILSGALSMVLAVPAFASTANTSVTLQTDDAQLSVTAPSSIPLSMKGDGTFIAPAPSSTKIINNSVMPVAVKSAKIINILAGTSIEDDPLGGTPDNFWLLDVNGLPLALSDTPTMNVAWNMKSNGVSGNELQLTVSGSMMNVDGSVDFSAAKTLGNIVWTFGSKLN